MENPFTAHPARIGESYGRHLVAAMGFGLRLIGAGLACCLHALLPFLCERSGSSTVIALHDELTARRRVTDETLPEAAE